MHQSLILPLSLLVEIRFNPVQYQVNEETRLVTFEVENRNPDRVGQYSIQFTTIDGSAIQSTDGGLLHDQT